MEKTFLIISSLIVSLSVFNFLAGGDDQEAVE